MRRFLPESLSKYSIRISRLSLLFPVRLEILLLITNYFRTKFTPNFKKVNEIL